MIDRNAQRLLKLVNTLLDFSRLESDQAGPRPEPLDLARYTAELAAMFDSAVAPRGADAHDRLPAAAASRSRSTARCGPRSCST